MSAVRAYNDRMRLIKAMQDVLQTAAKERRQREERVHLGDEHEPGWVFYEREQLTAAVNRERSARGLPPVTLKDVRRVERWAVGHSDYSEKYALYCAELALGETPVR